MSHDHDPKPLRRITTITLCDEPYDLAINGDHYHLVEHKEPDAYLRPVAREVDIVQWTDHEGRAQALLDLLGEKYERITALEIDLERVSAALQREAEPAGGSRRPVAREGAGGSMGVLEEPKVKGRGDQ